MRGLNFAVSKNTVKTAKFYPHEILSTQGLSIFSSRCAEVTDSINVFISLMSDKSENHIHKEVLGTRVKRDHEDYMKLKEWFENHNPFEVEENLVALDTGLTDVHRKVTCDRSEEVGASIQNQITGESFSTCSFKRKNQIVTLQSLYSSVKIGNEKVTIDPLTLFLRLVVMIGRKPDEEIKTYFEYELSSFPLSLFKDGCMRSTQKSKLKSFLKMFLMCLLKKELQ